MLKSLIASIHFCKEVAQLKQDPNEIVPNLTLAIHFCKEVAQLKHRHATAIYKKSVILSISAKKWLN